MLWCTRRLPTPALCLDDKDDDDDDDAGTLFTFSLWASTHKEPPIPGVVPFVSVMELGLSVSQCFF